MKRIIFSCIGIGVVTVFLFLSLLDYTSTLRTSWSALVWFCIFWYVPLGLTLYSGIKAFSKKVVR